MPDPRGPVVTPPPAPYQVPQHAIFVPSPSVHGEPLVVLLPRVVQLASPSTTLTMPPLFGYAQCLLFRDGLHHSVICDDCDMMPVEINMEMLNPQATARISSSEIPQLCSAGNKE